MIFTKGPVTVCIINTTPQDLILKSGQILANLSPIELQQSNTHPILGSKMGGSCDVNQLHSLFQNTFDGSKRIDNDLPQSLFNITKCNDTLKEDQMRVAHDKIAA